ncbi:hypothetical protein ACQP3J_29165, partial [Escherichia coli]
PIGLYSEFQDSQVFLVRLWREGWGREGRRKGRREGGREEGREYLLAQIFVTFCFLLLTLMLLSDHFFCFFLQAFSSLQKCCFKNADMF